MGTPNPPADPAATSAAIGLLQRLYASGLANNHYVGANTASSDSWLNPPGLSAEQWSYYLTTGHLPSLYSTNDQSFYFNSGRFDLSSDNYYDSWGNSLPQWAQTVAGAYEFFAEYDGIVQLATNPSVPDGLAYASTTAAAATISNGTGLVTQAAYSGYTNPAALIPGAVSGSGPYTVTIPAGAVVNITQATVTGTAVTITASGTWTTGTLVTIAGLTNGSGGTNWTYATGTFAITTGGTGSFTITVGTSTPTGTSAYGGATVASGGVVAGQSIVSGMTVSWTGSSGTWTVSAPTVNPTATAQATTFTLTQTSGSGGVAPSTSVVMAFAGTSSLPLNAAYTAASAGFTTTTTNNWGFGVTVIGTTASLEYFARFTYTGWYYDSGNAVWRVTGVKFIDSANGVLLPANMVSTVVYTVRSGAPLCQAAAAGYSTGNDASTGVPLQWSANAYGSTLLNTGTATTYRTAQSSGGNTNLNFHLDYLASMCNYMNASALPIVLRMWAESNSNYNWWSTAWFPLLWTYSVAYLTGGTGPAYQPGGFRGAAVSLGTCTVAQSGQAVTFTGTSTAYPFASGDYVYFSNTLAGPAGLATALAGKIMPLQPGSSPSATSFTVIVPTGTSISSGSVTAGTVAINQPVIGGNGAFYGGTPAAPQVPCSVLPLPVTLIQASGGTLTYTTAYPHGLVAGQVVNLMGSTFSSGNCLGVQTVASAPTASTFTVTNGATGPSAYGTYSPQLVPVHNAVYCSAYIPTAEGAPTYTNVPPGAVDVLSYDIYLTGGMSGIATGLNTLQAATLVVSNLSGSAGTVTVTTGGAHHLTTGDYVSFSGLSSATGTYASLMNTQLFQVTVTGTVGSSTTFTVTCAATGSFTAGGTTLPWTNIPVGISEYGANLTTTADLSQVQTTSCTYGYSSGQTGAGTPTTIAALAAQGYILTTDKVAPWSTATAGVIMGAEGPHLFTITGYSTFGAFGLIFISGLAGNQADTINLTAGNPIIAPQVDLAGAASGALTSLTGTVFSLADVAMLIEFTTNGSQAAVTNGTTTPITLTVGSSPTPAASGIQIGMVFFESGGAHFSGQWYVSAMTTTTITITANGGASCLGWSAGAAITCVFGGFGMGQSGGLNGTIAVPTTSGVVQVEFSAVSQYQGYGNTATFTLVTTLPTAGPTGAALAGSIPSNSFVLPLGKITQVGVTSQGSTIASTFAPALTPTSVVADGSHAYVTVTYSAGHNLVTGMLTTFTGLAGSLAFLNYPSTWVVTVTGATTFTVTNGTTPPSSTQSAGTTFVGGGWVNTAVNASPIVGTPPYLSFVAFWSDTFAPLYQNPWAVDWFFNQSTTFTLSQPQQGNGSMGMSGTTGYRPMIWATGTGALSLSGTGIASRLEQGNGSMSLSGLVASPGGGPSGAGALSLTGTGTTGAGTAAAGAIAMGGSADAGGTTFADGSGSLGLAGSTTAAAGPTGAGDMGMSGSAVATFSYFAAGTGALAMSGATTTGAVGGYGSGNIAMSGIGGSGRPATGGGTLALSGLTAYLPTFPATATGAITLGGTVLPSPNPAPSGQLSLNGTGTSTAAGGAASGTLALTGAGTYQPTVLTSGQLSLSGTASAGTDHLEVGAGTLTLSGTSAYTGAMPIPSAYFTATARTTSFVATARTTTFVA